MIKVKAVLADRGYYHYRWQNELGWHSDAVYDVRLLEAPPFCLIRDELLRFEECQYTDPFELHLGEYNAYLPSRDTIVFDVPCKRDVANVIPIIVNMWITMYNNYDEHNVIIGGRSGANIPMLYYYIGKYGDAQVTYGQVLLDYLLNTLRNNDNPAKNVLRKQIIRGMQGGELMMFEHRYRILPKS